MVSIPSDKSERLKLYQEDTSLKASISDAMYFNIMVGKGESYLSAFCVFLKALPFQIGMLSGLPPLIGAISQLLGVKIMDRVSRRRALIVSGASIQGIVWLLIALIPFVWGSGPRPVFIVIAAALAYQAFGNLGTPAWNSLIGDLVPRDVRGDYFGFRNQRAALSLLLSLIIGGAVLHVSKSLHVELYGFLLLFIIAGTARLRSAYFISLHADPQYSHSSQDSFGLYDFVRRAPHSNFAKFVFFFSLMNASVAVAGPYFTIYMLSDLKLSYFTFTLLTAASLIAQVLTLHYWGGLSDQFGNKKILNLCSIGLCIIPFLWMISSNTIVIFLAQAFSGTVWAGYSLASANFMFDAVTPPKRGRCAAYQALISALFVWLGTMVGGIIIANIPESAPLASGLFTPESKTIRCMFISGLLRIAVCITFLRKFREVREVVAIRHRDLIFRMMMQPALNEATFHLLPSRIFGKRTVFVRRKLKDKRGGSSQPGT